MGVKKRRKKDRKGRKKIQGRGADKRKIRKGKE